jgi:hypothetical protein
VSRDLDIVELYGALNLIPRTHGKTRAHALTANRSVFYRDLAESMHKVVADAAVTVLDTLPD